MEKKKKTIKLTQDKLTGEKETNFNSCAQRPHRNGTLKMEKASSFDIFYTINLCGIVRRKKLRFSVPN